MFSKTRAQNITTLVFALLTTLPMLEGNIANGELILMPFVLTGMYGFGDFGRKNRLLP